MYNVRIRGINMSHEEAVTLIKEFRDGRFDDCREAIMKLAEAILVLAGED